MGGIGKDVGCADLRAPRAKDAGQQDQLRAWPGGFLKEIPEMYKRSKQMALVKDKTPGVPDCRIQKDDTLAPTVYK